jgi:hypothetical protein
MVQDHDHISLIQIILVLLEMMKSIINLNQNDRINSSDIVESDIEMKLGNEDGLLVL